MRPPRRDPAPRWWAWAARRWARWTPGERAAHEVRVRHLVAGGLTRGQADYLSFREIEAQHSTTETTTAKVIPFRGKETA